MQLLVDLFPVIAFYATYMITHDMFAATGVIMLAVIAQTGWQWFRHRKVSQMALISGGMLMVFGSLTLLIHDPIFIKWKVSVVYWLLAGGFLVSRFFGDKTMIERMLGHAMQLEDQTLWRRLNWGWICFFTAVGFINLYVMYNFSETFWVNFKLFGVFGLTFLFLIGQFVWLSSKLPPEETPPQSEKPQ
jgi:intracellular septation protein